MTLSESDVTDLWSYEREARSQGYSTICGIDEAGRGPLAGPVVAAAVILPHQCSIEGIRDSKQLSEKKRSILFDEIMSVALDVGVGVVDADIIDRINILQATYKAMLIASSNLDIPVDLFLIDGSSVKGFRSPHRCIVKGDAKAASIAAASIIAKVTRDRIMCKYDETYPQYGFACHKGYPTKDHLQKLSLFGVSDIHRRSFKPVAVKLWEQRELPLPSRTKLISTD